MEPSSPDCASNLLSDAEHSHSEGRSEVLLPAFAARQYSHLPTPQSPVNLARYLHDLPQSPESPIPHAFSSQLSSSSTSQLQRSIAQKATQEEDSGPSESHFQQCITPESSPYISRNSPTTPRFFHTPSQSGEFITPKASSSHVKLEAPTPVPASAISAPRFSSPMVSPDPTPQSMLSSPFIARVATGDRGKRTTPQRPSEVDDVFSSPPPVVLTRPVEPASISTPPTSPPRSVCLPLVPVGGEIDRIRLAMEEDRLQQLHEAEKRRPEYLKRTKRTFSDSCRFSDDEDLLQDPEHKAIGIMESPIKGRRLKLFQETSEESFEESLMAGGYGRYRTNDWVRQPQPLPLPPSTPGHLNVTALHEEVQEEPPSEKEVIKRRRLAAFKADPARGTSKLCAIELEGKGRVLVDIPKDDNTRVASPEVPPSKKRAPSRRKKKSADISNNDKNVVKPPGAVDDVLERPNWPDSEFPWRLRTEERVGRAREQEAERLKWIERFLDRDSDEDEDADTPPRNSLEDSDREDGSHSRWGSDYPGAKPSLPVGRGKMVPLRVYPTQSHSSVKRTPFPSDPADAFSALMSKRSVRTLSYRQQMRRGDAGESDGEGEEILCICHGKDDGRELVQCDACETWYHLECIGIKDVSELGREEDPWFCRRCVARSRSPSVEPSDIPTSEPTFVPTDEGSLGHRSSDTPFFQPALQDSPTWQPSRIPRTPTRPTYAHSGATFVYPPSWTDLSRNNPSTPQRSAHIGRHQVVTPHAFDSYVSSYDEAPFDPTSTPSRGIKFTAPFATPKTNIWPSRPNGTFQTPLKGHSRSALRSFGGTGSLSAALEDGPSRGPAHPHRIVPHDDSPVRRNRSYDGSMKRRPMHSPSRTRSSITTSLLDESPFMWPSEVHH